MKIYLIIGMTRNGLRFHDYYVTQNQTQAIELFLKNHSLYDFDDITIHFQGKAKDIYK